VLKNTGKYTELYVAVRARLGREVGEEELKLTEERRAAVAPCDNIGEIASPVVIMITIALESLFDALPIERAPYFADTGIMGSVADETSSGGSPDHADHCLRCSDFVLWHINQGSFVSAPRGHRHYRSERRHL
jgi:hypothetical protein